MSDKNLPDLGLYVDILQTLKSIDAPYMIIGAFAGIIYGVTRVTYDIDIVVDLNDKHINALAEAYPPPRYYADPEMMRNSISMGIMFNIIDTNRGDKADLIPLTDKYSKAFTRRITQSVEIPGIDPFEVWCARQEDVIIGKLMAWAEGRSRKHETDIYDMMVFLYLDADPSISAEIDEGYVDKAAVSLGEEVSQLWASIKESAGRVK